MSASNDPSTKPDISPRPDAEIPETYEFAPSRLSDRRSHRRFRVERAGKVFRRSTQSFCATTSQDLSFGGALLAVHSARPFQVGEILEVGLALTNKPIVPEANLLRAIVVRTSPGDKPDTQTVAVRYLHREAIALKAA